jgi:hypothetical protein
MHHHIQDHLAQSVKAAPATVLATYFEASPRIV